MMANKNLGDAKKAKQDEFYTQYADIEKEMNAYLEYNPDVFRDKTILLPCDDPEWSNFTRYFAQNFEKFRLKKLISTSYAPNSKPIDVSYQPPLFELESDRFDEVKTRANGKIFTLTQDITGDQKIDVEDLEWGYLEGDGDFQSEEVTKLRDEADFVITNPPFSLFRVFLSWIIAGGCQFSVIGNKNAVTYKELFPRIKENQLWLGFTSMSQDMLFAVPAAVQKEFVEMGKQGSSYRIVSGQVMGRSSSVWFTSIEHGKRHQKLGLMTYEDNLRFNKAVSENGYQKYDNYDAIEVPRTNAIPSDYEGVMGVPISFLDKYNPEQFEIVRFRHGDDDRDLRLPNGKCPYFRILIRHRGKN